MHVEVIITSTIAPRKMISPKKIGGSTSNIPSFRNSKKSLDLDPTQTPTTGTTITMTDLQLDLLVLVVAVDQDQTEDQTIAVALHGEAPTSNYIYNPTQSMS